MLTGVLILATGVVLGLFSWRGLAHPGTTQERHLAEQARIPLLAMLNPFRFPALQPIGVACVWLAALVGAFMSVTFIVVGVGAILGYWELS